jgi:hypothetical protein
VRARHDQRVRHLRVGQQLVLTLGHDLWPSEVEFLQDPTGFDETPDSAASGPRTSARAAWLVAGRRSRAGSRVEAPRPDCCQTSRAWPRGSPCLSRCASASSPPWHRVESCTSPMSLIASALPTAPFPVTRAWRGGIPLRREPDDGVVFEITVFSRPADALARLGGPIARAVQDRTTRRYLEGVRHYVAVPP